MKHAPRIAALATLVALLTAGTLASAQEVPPPPPPADEAPSPPPPPAPPTTAPAPPTTAPAPYYPATPYPQAPVYTPPPPPYPGYHQPPPPAWNQPFRLGPYFGASVGAMGFAGGSGPFQEIGPGVYGSVYVGMYFGSRLALELGFMGSVHQDRFSYEAPSSLTMWGLTLDVRYNLVRPAWRSRFIPYLQAGVGVYGLVGDRYDADGYGSSGSLATGGGFQLGGGVDLFVSRWLTVGARVLYRGIVLGQMQCGDGCMSEDPANRSYLHAVTGELNAAIVF